MALIERRSFLLAALAALPATALWRSTKPDEKTAPPPMVAAGADRFGKKRFIPTGTTTFKVATQDSAGALFITENRSTKKGGPPLHVHHQEDELFYVIEGDYIVQIRSEQHHLKAGDCILGPRGVPHTWAFVGETPGRLLLSFAPAGNMEAFFVEQLDREGGVLFDAEMWGKYGMKRVGPPIKI
jgi:mannose-6-phosphate isomerase-like protein (cupin superfamily)